jgi:hypothetical protein
MMIRKTLNLICFFGMMFCSCVIAQNCDAQKPKFIYVSQKPCPSCFNAKRALETLKSDGSLEDFEVLELDLRKDRKELDDLGIGPVRTPTFAIVDALIHPYTLQSNELDAIREFAKAKPIPLFDSTQLALPDSVLMLDAPSTGPPPVVVTWDLATQYRSGAYNGTAAFSEIENGLNTWGLYWNIKYQRVTRGGQYHVIQASYDLGKDVAARTGGNTCLVSPTFRFVNATQFKMVMCHENRHTRILAHHSQDGGMMGPNGGYLLLQSDMPYFSAMTWKSAKRPWDNPGEWKQALSGTLIQGLRGDSDGQFPLMKEQR